MKKFALKFIILFFIAALFTGCVPAPVEYDDENTDSGKTNMYGEEFILMQFNSNTLGEGDPLLYVAGSAIADMALTRLAGIEADHNCTIKINYTNKDGNWLTKLHAAAGTGQRIADMFFSGNSDATYKLVSGGFLYPIFSVNDIIGYDSSTFDIYGTPQILEAAMYKGELYMVSPYAHPARQLKSGSFYAVNTELMSSLAGVDIRALNELGDWTWSAFENIVKLCTVKEEGTVSIYGSSSTDGDFTEYALLSNGFTRVRKNADGLYEASLKTPNVTMGIDWVRKISTEYSDYVKFESRGEAFERFSEGKSAMFFITSEYLKNWVIYQPHEFAIVPFPCGPYGDPETNSGSIALEGLGIYAYTDSPEYVAEIIRDYCQPFEEYPTMDSAIEYYNEMFWDTRDVNVMMQAEKNLMFSYYMIGGGGLTDAIVANIDRMSSAQIVESYAHIMDELIEEWIIPNNELIDELKAS